LRRYVDKDLRERGRDRAGGGRSERGVYDLGVEGKGGVRNRMLVSLRGGGVELDNLKT
jgi:hypothetical protein